MYTKALNTKIKIKERNWELNLPSFPYPSLAGMTSRRSSPRVIPKQPARTQTYTHQYMITQTQY
jgi:hypothetical protein